MSHLKETPSEMTLEELFSKTYPLETLIQMAEIQAESETPNKRLSKVVEQKRLRLMRSPKFYTVYRGICIGPDIDVTIPSTGKTSHLLRGSDFDVTRLAYLEDAALNQALINYGDYFGLQRLTSRDYFLEQFLKGSILLATLDISNTITSKERKTLISSFLSNGAYHYSNEGNWYKSAILLYAGGIIMANRLDFPIENSQPASWSLK